MDDDELDDIGSFLGGGDDSSSDGSSGIGSLLSSGLTDAGGIPGLAQDLGLGTSNTAATTAAPISSSTLLIGGGLLAALVLLA